MGIIGARDVGAPHKRDRMWVLAYANNDGNITTEESQGTAQGSNSSKTRQEQTIESTGLCASRADGGMEWITDPATIPNPASQRGCRRDSSREDAEDARQLGSCKGQDSEGMEEGNFEPFVGRVANGVANRVDRLKAIGNGQVPQCAAMAFSILSEGLTSRLVTNA